MELVTVEHKSVSQSCWVTLCKIDPLEIFTVEIEDHSYSREYYIGSVRDQLLGSSEIRASEKPEQGCALFYSISEAVKQYNKTIKLAEKFFAEEETKQAA